MVIAIYARGITVHEIQGFFTEQHRSEVSPKIMNAVTAGVPVKVTAQHSGSLDPINAAVLSGSPQATMRNGAAARNRPIDFVLGLLADGAREVLGIWVWSTEAAKVSLEVVNDIKILGDGAILIILIEHLSGTPERLEAALLQPNPQTNIVRLLRGALKYVSWNDRKVRPQALCPIYAALSEDTTLEALVKFERNSWGERITIIAMMQRRAWDRAIPFLAAPP